MSICKPIEIRNECDPSAQWIEVELMAFAIALAFIALGVSAWIVLS